jgi:hypothetical protein
MCNCKKEICDRIRNNIHPDADFVSYTDSEILSGKTFSHIEVTLPGKKKPITVNVLHSFCPHCGEPYEAGEESQ